MSVRKCRLAMVLSLWAGVCTPSEAFHPPLRPAAQAAVAQAAAAAPARAPEAPPKVGLGARFLGLSLLAAAIVVAASLKVLRGRETDACSQCPHRHGGGPDHCHGPDPTGACPREEPRH